MHSIVGTSAGGQAESCAGTKPKAPTAHPGFRLVVACDSHPRSNDAIIADPCIKAVRIAMSTDTHSDLIKRANAAGKAAMCERPFHLSLDCARACQTRSHPGVAGYERRLPLLRPTQDGR
jgi:Oxidoreductase family, NAD-binding Rossmann fold